MDLLKRPRVVRLKIGVVRAARTCRRRVTEARDRHQRPVSSAASPIFIAGCSHSGTTLMASMLNTSPSVRTVPSESGAFVEATTRKAIAAMWLGWQKDASAKGKDRVCEKTPNHVFHLDRLFRYFPSAKVVLMVRDGRDVAASLFARTGELRPGANKWVRAQMAAEPYASDPRVHVVRYEDLVRSPDRTLRVLCRELDIEFSPRMVTDREPFALGQDPQEVDRPPSLTGADHLAYRNWQINQPLFDGAGRWQTDLDAEQQTVVEKIVGATLDRLGYPLSAARG